MMASTGLSQSLTNASPVELSLLARIQAQAERGLRRLRARLPNIVLPYVNNSDHSTATHQL